MLSIGIGIALNTIYYVLIAMGLTMAVTLITYILSEPAVISNAINVIENTKNDIMNNIRTLISSFIIKLSIVKEYFKNELHHIVAKRDWRAFPARVMLQEVGIGVDDEVNLVFIKKEYHRVMHTKAYHYIVDLCIIAGYVYDKKQGILEVLEIFREILGGYSYVN